VFVALVPAASLIYLVTSRGKSFQGNRGVSLPDDLCALGFNVGCNDDLRARVRLDKGKDFRDRQRFIDGEPFSNQLISQRMRRTRGEENDGQLNAVRFELSPRPAPIEERL
jgi:hypothetical protein